MGRVCQPLSTAFACLQQTRVSGDERRDHQHQKSQDKSMEEKLTLVGHLHLNSINTSSDLANTVSGHMPLCFIDELSQRHTKRKHCLGWWRRCLWQRYRGKGLLVRPTWDTVSSGKMKRVLRWSIRQVKAKDKDGLQGQVITASLSRRVIWMQGGLW